MKKLILLRSRSISDVKENPIISSAVHSSIEKESANNMENMDVDENPITNVENVDVDESPLRSMGNSDVDENPIVNIDADECPLSSMGNSDVDENTMDNMENIYAVESLLSRMGKNDVNENPMDNMKNIEEKSVIVTRSCDLIVNPLNLNDIVIEESFMKNIFKDNPFLNVRDEDNQEIHVNIMEGTKLAENPGINEEPIKYEESRDFKIMILSFISRHNTTIERFNRICCKSIHSFETTNRFLGDIRERLTDPCDMTYCTIALSLLNMKEKLDRASFCLSHAIGHCNLLWETMDHRPEDLKSSFRHSSQEMNRMYAKARRELEDVAKIQADV